MCKNDGVRTTVFFISAWQNWLCQFSASHLAPQSLQDVRVVGWAWNKYRCKARSILPLINLWWTDYSKFLRLKLNISSSHVDIKFVVMLSGTRSGTDHCLWSYCVNFNLKIYRLHALFRVHLQDSGAESMPSVDLSVENVLKARLLITDVCTSEQSKELNELMN